jgi:hypothetical protein
MFSSDLSKFDRFVFLNSKISEIFVAGPKLPEIETIEGFSLKEQRRIAFNQLKKVYENRGDGVTAMKYQVYEMEIYSKQLASKEEDRISGERFQLGFNKYTNKHGSIWNRPLIFLLAFSILAYSGYWACLYGVSGQFQPKAIAFYFEFLNPTHKTDFLIDFKNKQFTNWYILAILIDYTNRIVIGLLLYQMIQAFRKYGKKM